MEHVTGIEPVSTAWKAVVIAIIRHVRLFSLLNISAKRNISSPEMIFIDNKKSGANIPLYYYDRTCLRKNIYRN